MSEGEIVVYILVSIMLLPVLIELPVFIADVVCILLKGATKKWLN